MKKQLKSVEIVEEGIMVEFGTGTRCFFSTVFLQSQVGIGSNHIFLNYDPSPGADTAGAALLRALDTSSMPIQ